MMPTFGVNDVKKVVRVQGDEKEEG